MFISANTAFYGDLTKKVFNLFSSEVKTNNYEATIVGNLGLTMFRQTLPDRAYSYFELPDYGIDAQKLSEAIKHLVQYEEIRVYYGKYQSVVTQKPTTFSISAGTPVSGKIDQQRPSVYYIFEPSVEKILMFFETQIFASLFDQSIRESQLAKFASRILAMDRATENIHQRLNNLGLERMKLSHGLENKKQLNALTSVIYSG